MSLASPSRNGLHLHLIIEVDFPCRVFGVFFRLLRYYGGRFHESSVAPKYTSARQTNVVVSVFSDANDPISSWQGLVYELCHRFVAILKAWHADCNISSLSPLKSTCLGSPIVPSTSWRVI